MTGTRPLSAVRGDQAQARAHEGRRPDRDVTVMSEPGKGTVFTVHLAGNSIKVAMVPTETCDPMSGLGNRDLSHPAGCPQYVRNALKSGHRRHWPLIPISTSNLCSRS